jgi:hypothetical protein
VIILSPKGSDADRSIPLVPPIGDVGGRVVGIIDNGHHNGTPVLEAIREILLDRHGASRVVLRRKPWISRPAPEELVNELRGTCDVVIAGVGDCGSCSSWSLHDAIEMHRRGLFGVSVITSTFIRMVKAEAKYFGIPRLPIVETPHHAGAVTREEACKDADAITPALVTLIAGKLEGASR